MTTLETRDLTVRFGRGDSALVAVDGVGLTVPEQTIVGLVGESGSGKSTLARAIVGLVPISGGEVLLDGVATAPPKQRTRLGAEPPRADGLPGSVRLAQPADERGRGDRRGRR